MSAYIYEKNMLDILDIDKYTRNLVIFFCTHTHTKKRRTFGAPKLCFCVILFITQCPGPKYRFFVRKKQTDKKKSTIRTFSQS